MKKLTILLFTAYCLLSISGCSPSCSSITDWDECEKKWGCSPVDYFVPNDYEGPIWGCESDNY